MSNVLIKWVGTRAVAVKLTPAWKIDHAVDIVKQAYSGELRFQVNEFIPPPKVFKRPHLSRKWLEDNRYDPTHDHYTCKQWRKNLNMIRNALKLLYKEGIVDGYHVDGSGNLEVKWFEKYKPVVRQVRTAMRTGEQLQRADVFARVRYPEIDQYMDIEPANDPYHWPVAWREYAEMEEDYEPCIVTRMLQRKGQVDVLRIIERAYAEYDLDTLHLYEAPLYCNISDKSKAWEALDFDASAPKLKSSPVCEPENRMMPNSKK